MIKRKWVINKLKKRKKNLNNYKNYKNRNKNKLKKKVYIILKRKKENKVSIINNKKSFN